MAKPSRSATRLPAKPETRVRRPVRKTLEPDTRIQRMVQLIDHCSAAQAVADDLNASFLAYLLAMAIQEARSQMRGSLL